MRLSRVRFLLAGFSSSAWRCVAFRPGLLPSTGQRCSSRRRFSWDSSHASCYDTRHVLGTIAGRTWLTRRTRRRDGGGATAVAMSYNPDSRGGSVGGGGGGVSSDGTGSMTVIYDEFFLRHRPPPGHPHPECPARVSTAREELEGLEGVEWATPSSLRSREDRAGTLAAIERVHKPEYLDEVRRVCAKGGGAADFDTYICPDSFEVCVIASSAWMDAAESALRGSPAFALARPPGHHATAGVGMGFCLVCFAAVAAFHAVESLGCRRVAMLDFDVHHGNGVAALVKGDERIRYCSIHQGGIFPGSGEGWDSGPKGNLKHLPFYETGETWGTYEARFEEALSWLQAFEPDLVIVSAGYDALEADELATASLQPEDYGRWYTDVPLLVLMLLSLLLLLPPLLSRFLHRLFFKSAPIPSHVRCLNCFVV
ncbi:unnamed protein product [Scytosiphon promiscuus]